MLASSVTVRLRAALSLFALASLMLWEPIMAQGGGGTSTLCRFTSGPRAGQVQDYAPLPALPVGTPCQDGISSTGVVVAHTGGGGGGTPVPTSSGTTLICKFTSGPLAGQIKDFSDVPGVTPAPIGSPCTDGYMSTGIAIAPGSAVGGGGKGGLAPTSSSTTLTCKFTSGPLAGQVKDYSNVPGATPAPIGSPCTDGYMSTGTAIAPGNGGADVVDADEGEGADADSGVSTICQFTYGPKKGGWHDYAPQSPLPIGSPCNDGLASAGTVVETGTGDKH